MTPKWWSLIFIGVIAITTLTACEGAATATPTPGSMTTDNSAMGRTGGTYQR